VGSRWDRGGTSPPHKNCAGTYTPRLGFIKLKRREGGWATGVAFNIVFKTCFHMGWDSPTLVPPRSHLVESFNFDGLGRSHLGGTVPPRSHLKPTLPHPSVLSGWDRPTWVGRAPSFSFNKVGRSHQGGTVPPRCPLVQSFSFGKVGRPHRSHLVQTNKFNTRTYAFES